MARGLKKYTEPAATRARGTPVILGAWFGRTLMEKAGRDLVTTPSLTMITMFEYIPLAFGLPVKRPVSRSNFAQTGLLEIENLSSSLSASRALGANL
jgi:hypothetical protein